MKQNCPGSIPSDNKSFLSNKLNIEQKVNETELPGFYPQWQQKLSFK